MTDTVKLDRPFDWYVKIATEGKFVTITSGGAQGHFAVSDDETGRALIATLSHIQRSLDDLVPASPFNQGLGQMTAEQRRNQDRLRYYAEHGVLAE